MDIMHFGYWLEKERKKKAEQVKVESLPHEDISDEQEDVSAKLPQSCKHLASRVFSRKIRFCSVFGGSQIIQPYRASTNGL